jgi:hypothetical protein
MSHSFAKLIATSSIAMFASFAHAAWDFSISQGNSQLLASTSSFTADDDLRFASQMVSTNQPDANGFLYVENIAQYSCIKNAYQLVKAIGYKSWNDQGVSIDQTMGKWIPVTTGTPEQAMINKLCNLSVADASGISNK